jgi:DNA-binding MarR family transcriptional regulator
VYASVHAKYSVQPNQPAAGAVDVTESRRSRAAAAVLAAFERLRELAAQVHVTEFLRLDVTMQQAKALHLIGCSPGIRMSSLASRLGVGLSTVSGNVDRLADMGFVQRHGDPDDRRQVVVALTEQGHDVVDGFQDLGPQLMLDLLESLEPRELAALQRGVDGLIRALQERQAHAGVTQPMTTAAPS